MPKECQGEGATWGSGPGPTLIGQMSLVVSLQAFVPWNAQHLPHSMVQGKGVDQRRQVENGIQIKAPSVITDRAT